MHRGLENERARGPGFSGPARGRPGPLPSLVYIYEYMFIAYGNMTLTRHARRVRSTNPGPRVM